jgi:hypothetical protein
MTYADLRGLLIERARARARDMLMLAWRTAYYGRVEHLPDVRQELDDLNGMLDGNLESEGGMTKERHDHIWSSIERYFQASNARFARA